LLPFCESYTLTYRSAAFRLKTAVAACLLIAIAALSYGEWTQYRRARADAVLSGQILESVNDLLARLLDAETGQRGFLLTGQDRYLEPYNRAAPGIPAELANLNRLLVQRHGESGSLPRLNVLAGQKLTELRRTIELRKTQGAAPAAEVVISG